MNHLKFLVALSCLVLSHQVSADQYDQKALKETQDLLNDPADRKRAIEAGGAPAKKADEMIQQLTGGDPGKTAEIYGLAAELMAIIMQRADGDATKMKEMAESFAKDPEAFAKTWPEVQRAKLRELSQKMARPPAGVPK